MYSVGVDIRFDLLGTGPGTLVPPFIGGGEEIVVDTSEVTYMRRAD